MKKVIFFVLVFLIASGCNKSTDNNQKTNSSSAYEIPLTSTDNLSPLEIGNLNQQYANKPVPKNNSAGSVPKTLTSADDIGEIIQTEDSENQIYINNNLGFQLVIPKNWVLGTIYGKDGIFFNDPIDVEKNFEASKEQNPQFNNLGKSDKDNIINSPVYGIMHYQDFQSWREYNEPYTDCQTISECFQKNKEEQVTNLQIDNNPSWLVYSTEGDMPVVKLFIEHNGIYDFGNIISWNFIKLPSFPNVEKNLKFFK